MRSLLSLLLLLTLSAATVAPDTGARVLAPDSEARWVPFTLTPANQVVFAATLDGQQVNALLDTGASLSLITRDFARKSARKVEARGRVAAIGGAVTLGWTPIRSLSFGGLSRTGGGLNVVALPTTATGNGQAIRIAGRARFARSLRARHRLCEPPIPLAADRAACPSPACARR